ncbi:unnamed protein product [Caenorhabditis brenneri]
MEQNSSFLDFLVKKTKNARTYLDRNQLVKEFKEHSGSPETINELNSRLRTIRLQIAQLPGLDKETKVKLMFALWAPVPPSYLEILKKEAIVKTDEKQRITYYAGNGLILTGSPRTPVKLEPTYDMQVLMYLEERAAFHVPIPDEGFLYALEQIKGIKYSMERYKLLKNEIYAAPRFHKDSKIRMMFVAGAHVTEAVLKELRVDAYIEVDNEFRIKKYISNDGTLKLPPGASKKKQWNPSQSAHERMSGLVKYLAEMTRNVTTPMFISELCRGYLKSTGSLDDPLHLADRLRTYKSHLHKLTEYGVETRVKIMFALSATVDSQFLKMLREYAYVEVDEKQRITRYESNDGLIQLRGDHSQKSKAKNSPYSKKRRDSEDVVEQEEGEGEMEDVKPNYNDEDEKIKEMSYSFNEFRALIKSEIQKRKEAEIDQIGSRSQVYGEMDDISLPGHSDAAPVEQKCSAWLRGARLSEEPQGAGLSEEPGGAELQDIEVITVDDDVKIEPQEQCIQAKLTHHKVLKALRTVLLTIDSSNLHKTLEKIENKLRKTSPTAEISSDGVLLGMESCLHMILKNSSMKPDLVEENRSLKEFVMLLRSAIFTMDSEILEKFQQKLKELSAELFNVDKYISIEKIESSLEIALTIFSP